MFALVDCNNFYASCERVFRPDLQYKPIIVLSNNDGCVIARSNESKALGIPMGAPFFKIKALCRQHNIQVFSSNYALYGDMSERVMSVIEENWPEVEIYSIDEAFLSLNSLPEDKQYLFCDRLQKLILKQTGIPTTIGIGKTKTLAKVANHVAKKTLKTEIFNIIQPSLWLDKIKVEEVWGVGYRWAKKLRALQIQTAGDLARADLIFIRQRFGVVLQRVAYELKGLACLQLEEIAPNKSIISSKSFGQLQTEYEFLAQAISSHSARAWEKMREQKLMAQYLSIFVKSSSFRKDLPAYQNSIGMKLIIPSDDIRYLTHCAKSCLKLIYKPRIHYKKVGILLSDLIPKKQRQLDFLHPVAESERIHTEKLMNAIEGINKHFGDNTIRLAAEGYSAPWAARKEMKSPNYTTQWNEIPLVYAR